MEGGEQVGGQAAPAPGVAGPDLEPEVEAEEGAFTVEGVLAANAPGALLSTASAAARWFSCCSFCRWLSASS